MTLVTKCAEAIETGDLGNLNKDHFARALDDLSKSYAAEHRISVHKAYGQILATPLGSVLYSAYDVAPSAPLQVQKSAPDSSESWRDIEQAAREFRLDHPQLSESQAIAKVLRAEPGLYDDYEAEARAAGRR